MSVVRNSEHEFQHMMRILNTNIDGTQKAVYALTAIKGVGRRFSTLVLKKANVDTTKRAGDLTAAELDRIVNIMNEPTEFKIPNWFLNRQKDFSTGKSKQVLSMNLSSVLRDDLVRMKKIKCHRGIRHHWNLRVRGQHTKTTGHTGRTVGVSKRRGGQ
eukprot:TRINITY_DN245_c0_g2_i1.p1 TRINITY_DN245_c0_g2~~TRINITY_DN245_c0_g2_i1.p1  ORF type:complete len:158 (-),score=21.36 TRINITY_DN245_c0_g2_i1:41-514(-)